MAAAARSFPELRVLEVLGAAEWRGAHGYLAQLLPALPDRIRATVVVPSEGSSAQRLRELGATVVVFPIDDGAHLATSVMRMVETVERQRIDVIHAHLSQAHVVAALASALTGAGTFATIHGQGVPMRELEVVTRGWSRVGVCTEAAYSQARLVGLGPEQVALVGTGVDADRFCSGARGCLRAVWRLSLDTPLVGFVGRLEGQRGATDFARLCGDVARRNDSAHFVVIGDGPLRGRMEEIAHRSGIAHRFHLCDTVADMPAVLRELDVLVVTRSVAGAPLGLLEAMACEVAPVATAVGGIPEIIVDGSSGSLFADGDTIAGARAVVALLGDSSCRAAIGRAARTQVVARFPLDAHIERIVTELERTAGRSEARARDIAPVREARLTP